MFIVVGRLFKYVHESLPLRSRVALFEFVFSIYWTGHMFSDLWTRYVIKNPFHYSNSPFTPTMNMMQLSLPFFLIRLLTWTFVPGPPEQRLP